MLIVVTGNGKGKTTSALGQALRVIGDGGKAVMFQFIKGPWISGEDKFFTTFHLPPSTFQIIKGGLGFVGIRGDTYPKSAHVKAARDCWAAAKKAIESRKYNLVILDEINVAIKLGLLKIAHVISFLKKQKGSVNIMATGRYAHPKLIALADLASEIKDVKHPFRKGVAARKGVEY